MRLELHVPACALALLMAALLFWLIPPLLPPPWPIAAQIVFALGGVVFLALLAVALIRLNRRR